MYLLTHSGGLKASKKVRSIVPPLPLIYFIVYCGHGVNIFKHGSSIICADGRYIFIEELLNEASKYEQVKVICVL